jgi:hypothetical protein
MLEGDALIPLVPKQLATVARKGRTELGGTIELRGSTTLRIGMTRRRGVADRVPTCSVPAMKRSSRYKNSTISAKRRLGNGNSSSVQRSTRIWLCSARMS